MSCGCRCHANSGADCDAAHDTGSSGVASVPSCSPCDGGRPEPARSPRRRSRTGRRVAPAPDEQQIEVDDNTAELLALWRAMPAALARDSAGTITGDRHAKGAAKGSPATVNVTVVDTAALIETGLYEIAAEAVRLLNLERDILADPDRIIAALPDWYRSLTGRGQPLAKHIRSDLDRWVKQARAAIGTRRHDQPLGSNCPHHRAEAPTPLRLVGATAVLAPSLLAGPPKNAALLTGPACAECEHQTCAWIRDRRLTVAGRPTDWLLDRHRVPRWLSADGEPPFSWQDTTSVRCPFCRATWTSVAEKRLLALMLRELGDQVDLERLTA